MKKRCGRLRKEEKLKEPQYKKEASIWLTYIGSCYKEYKKKYSKMFYDLKYEFSEDTLNDTIIACYNSIARNNIKDMSEQGMRNYLFRALKTNVNAVDKYDKRKENTDEIINLYEKFTEQNESTYNKTKEQLSTDYQVIYVLDKVEENFDNVDFHLFRLKYLLPKCTYQYLKDLTGVKDCKRRICSIMKWLKENITKKEIINSFYNDYPDFE